MKQTEKYKLNKPEGTDTVDINVLNENMDIIENQFKSFEESIQEVFTSGSEKKEQLAANLTAMGVSSSSDESWSDLLAKILTIFTGTDVSDTTASEGDVLNGKVFYNNAGVRSTGSMEEHSEYTPAESLYCGGRTATDAIYVRIPKGAYLKDVGVGYPEITTTLGNVLSTAGISDRGIGAEASSVVLWQGNLYLRIPQGYYHGASWDDGASESEAYIPLSRVAQALGVDSWYMSERINLSGVQGSIKDYRGQGAIGTTNIMWDTGTDRLNIAALPGIYDCDWSTNHQYVPGANVRAALGITADKILSGSYIAGVWGAAIQGVRHVSGSGFTRTDVNSLYGRVCYDSTSTASNEVTINLGVSWEVRVVRISIAFVGISTPNQYIIERDSEKVVQYTKKYRDGVCTTHHYTQYDEHGVGNIFRPMQGNTVYIPGVENSPAISAVTWEAWE